MTRALPALMFVLWSFNLAAAESGVQYSIDRDALLINKDVGSERWAITYTLEKRRITGNVFNTESGSATFLSCDFLFARGQDQVFACFSADACPKEPCVNAYTFVSNVTLPESFFRARGFQASAPPIGFLRSGHGDEVVKTFYPLTDRYIAEIVHTGNRTFTVTTLDAGGKPVEPLANVVGGYYGQWMVNADGLKPFSFIKVEADGDWRITLKRPADAVLYYIDGSVAGSHGPGGDRVLGFVADEFKIARFECGECTSNVIVRGWGREQGDPSELWVNRTGPYSGEFGIPPTITFISVQVRDPFDDGVKGAGFNEYAPHWSLTVK